MWVYVVFWVLKLKILSLMLKYIVLVFLQIKTYTEHYKYHRNYWKLLKSQYLTHKSTHNSKIGEISAQYVGISHLLSISQKSQNLALLTFLTIVLTLYAFLTCTAQQSEQLIALIHLLWRLVYRVLNTCATVSLKAHNRHRYQWSS